MSTLTSKTSETSDRELFLPQDIRMLIEKVAELPEKERNSLEEAVLAVIRGTQRRHEVLRLIQEAVSQLRLDMKYLVFDLEATRRERDQAREAR